MIMFIILLILITITYPVFTRKSVLVDGKKITYNNKYYIFLISLVLIFILGFRGMDVGIDTKVYYDIYNSVKEFSLGIFFVEDIECGYYLLQYFVKSVFGEFQILLLIVAIFFITVISYHIYKYSSNPWLSYILFIIYGFYSFAMSATRQTIAIGFIMIAYEFIKQKKLFKFLIFVFIAMLFHISAIIFLPAYWFNKFKLNRKNILLFFMVGIALIGLRSPIQIIMNNFARIKYPPLETGGDIMYIFMLISVLIGVIYRRPFMEKSMNNIYLFYMMLSALLIMPLTQFHPAVMRLYFYFFVFLIIYIPNLLSSIKDIIIRYVGVGAYLVIGFIWFFTSIIPIEKLETYMFFWQ